MSTVPATELAAGVQRVLADQIASGRLRPNERINQDVPTAELTSLVPAKHMGFMEHHTQFAALVDNFAEVCYHTVLSAETI